MQNNLPINNKAVKPRPIAGPVPIPDESILYFSPETEAPAQAEPNDTQKRKKTVIYLSIFGILAIIGGSTGYILYSTGRITASNQGQNAVSTKKAPTPIPQF